GEGAAADRSTYACCSECGSDVPTLRRTVADGATGVLLRLADDPSRPDDRAANLRRHRDVAARVDRPLAGPDELAHRVLAGDEPRRHWHGARHLHTARQSRLLRSAVLMVPEPVASHVSVRVWRKRSRWLWPRGPAAPRGADARRARCADCRGSGD